jgi:hypothetical protein
MGLAAIRLTTIFLAAHEHAFSAAEDVFLACAARLFAGSLEQRRAPSLIPRSIWKLTIAEKKKEGAAEAGPYISVKYQCVAEWFAGGCLSGVILSEAKNLSLF